MTTLLLPELFHREDEAEPEPSSVSAVAEELTDQASATLSAEPARVSYQVDGVHCEGCVERINDGLSSLSGVMTVQADTAGRVHLEGTTSPATVSEGSTGSASRSGRSSDRHAAQDQPAPIVLTPAATGRKGDDRQPSDRGPSWFDGVEHAGTPGRWQRYQDLVWALLILVVVVGLGVWNVIADGPIHPHV